MALIAVLAISPSGCTVFERTPPVPSPSPLQADNGTDLAACRDADCQVEVREDDVVHLDSTTGVSAFEIEHLSEEKITLRLTGTGELQTSNVHLDSDGDHVVIDSYKSGRINDVEIMMTPGDSSRAVLTLNPV